MMEEWLDIVDEEGNPTGKTVERSAAHREGIRHRTAHVWLARIREGRPQLLLQKRSRDKDSHPGCFDMSSGGHIPAGVEYLPSAIRELQEELGVTDRLRCAQVFQKGALSRGSFSGLPGEPGLSALERPGRISSPGRRGGGSALDRL